MVEEETAAHLKNLWLSHPVLMRTAEDLLALLDAETFQEINLTKDIRFYVSF